MNDPSSASKACEALRRSLEDHDDVAAAYLYGSVSRGDATPLSDVDVAVLLGEGVAGDDLRRDALLARLGTEISRALGPGTPDLDLHDLERIPLALRGRILSEGRLAVSNDPVRRVHFEVRTRQRYFDFLPYLRSDTREGLEALRERYLGG